MGQADLGSVVGLGCKVNIHVNIINFLYSLYFFMEIN